MIGYSTNKPISLANSNTIGSFDKKPLSMCYDISFRKEIKQLSDYFPGLIEDDRIHIQPEAATHIIGHAYAEHPIIYRNNTDGQLHLKLMEWGCIPFYIKDETLFKKSRTGMLNARSEKILTDTKSYWYKIRNRRCLIPVTGIYEHREITGWKNKVPYFIDIPDQSIFFLPGLYSVAELPDKSTGEILKRWTFTLITRQANEIMSKIHNGGENKGRMPLFLPLEKARQWVLDELTPEEYANLLKVEMPSSALRYYPVYTIRSSKLRPDGLDKHTIYQWPDLPEL